MVVVSIDAAPGDTDRSEEHTSELQSHVNLVCRLLLEKKKSVDELRQTPAPQIHLGVAGAADVRARVHRAPRAADELQPRLAAVPDAHSTAPESVTYPV